MSILTQSDHDITLSCRVTALAGREVLTANRAYYVATNGNDNNDGLSANSPFLTIQRAIDVISKSLDMLDYQVTVYVADGTYTTPVSFKPYVGSVVPIITGNSGAPGNVIISVTGDNAFYNGTGSGWSVSYVKIQTSSVGSGVLALYSGSIIWLISVHFGACTAYHINARFGGSVDISGDYTISGSAIGHIEAEYGGFIFSSSTSTVTLTGTPAFAAAFAYAYCNGIIRYTSKTFSGSATGRKYLCELSGAIYTGGLTLPGSTAGITSTSLYA